MLSGLASEPIKPSHSSVTTKDIRMSGFLEANNLQRFIIGLMWPRPGKGIATTWQTVVDSTSKVGSISTNYRSIWGLSFDEIKKILPFVVHS